MTPARLGFFQLGKSVIGIGVLKCGLKSMLTLFYELRKKMNKILIYTVIAIFLGAITMVTPLAVLKPSDYALAGKDSVSNAEPDAEAVERENMFTNPEEPSASLEDQEVLDSLPEEPAAYETVGNEEDVASSLSSIGMMIVPSFLIGLGVFSGLKKRML
jgi:hypothetical protein